MTHEPNPMEVAEVFRIFYEDPTNNMCMDCNAEAREWISINNAVSLCGNCAAAHSHFNEHISIIRAIHSPGWEWKDLMLLRNGGNLKFKLCMDEFKIDIASYPLNKYKTKAAFYYRRKLRHLCEGKPEPKAPTAEEAQEEVEHDNFLDKVSDFFAGIFQSKKDENLEAHPGPLVEETQAQGLLAPRIEQSEGLKSDSFRPELQPKQIDQKPLQVPDKGREDEPAKELPIEGRQLPIANDMQGNYEKKDWMPSQQMDQPPSIIPASINKDLKKGEKDLHKIEDKEIGEAKSAFEKIRDKTDNLLQEGLDKLKEGVHEGISLLKGEKAEEKHEEKPGIQIEELPKEEHQNIVNISEEKIKEAKASEAPVSLEAREAPIEEPELDIYRVLRHSKTREIIEHEQLMNWKHQRDEKELQSLAGEAAESIKARVLPMTTMSKAAQIAQQAAMVEAARGMTKLSKGADCDHEVMLHGHADMEYMEKLQELAKPAKQIEEETTIEEIRKSEDFGVPEIFRANITRLASNAPEPIGNAKPQKILSLKKKERRDARLARKKQRAEIQAQQPDHTKLTEHPVDITLSPLEKKIKEKELEGFLRPLDNTMLHKSFDIYGKPSPHTPKHSMEEGANMLGKPIIRASTAHMEPLTQKTVRRKRFFKQIHKKETTEDAGDKKITTEEIPKKIKRGDHKLSLAERFKQKVMGSFEIAKDKVTENLGLVRENSGSLIEAAKEKLEAVKEKATEKLEQVKDSAIMEATKEKFEQAKEKIGDAVSWIKDKFAPAAAAGVKVAEPNEPAPQQSEQTEQPAQPEQLKPVPLTETGEFATKNADLPKEEKELLKERLDF